MEDDNFSKLCDHLNKHLVGAPKKKAILEILRLRFTPEEAEVALSIPPVPTLLSEIATSSGKDETELRSMLERMADKGTVFKKTVKEGNKIQELYNLFPTVPGIWETSFAKGEKNPRTEQLARLWREYYDSGWGREMHRPETPLTRIIPIEKSITPQTAVLPYEAASGIVAASEFAAVMHCACRSATELTEEGCGKPTETCIHFGDFARFMADRGYARKVEQEEAAEILDMTEREGLVHLTINSQKDCLAICSCCSCCCTQLRAINELPKPGAVAKSGFFPIIDSDLCAGESCAICQSRCHMEAIGFTDDAADVNRDRCIGCALCVSACPMDAMSLEKDDRFPKPSPTIEDLAETIFREKCQ